MRKLDQFRSCDSDQKFRALIQQVSSDTPSVVISEMLKRAVGFGVSRATLAKALRVSEDRIINWESGSGPLFYLPPRLLSKIVAAILRQKLRPKLVV